MRKGEKIATILNADHVGISLALTTEVASFFGFLPKKGTAKGVLKCPNTENEVEVKKSGTRTVLNPTHLAMKKTEKALYKSHAKC